MKDDLCQHDDLKDLIGSNGLPQPSNHRQLEKLIDKLQHCDLIEDHVCDVGIPHTSSSPVRRNVLFLVVSLRSRPHVSLRTIMSWYGALFGFFERGKVIIVVCFSLM